MVATGPRTLLTSVHGEVPKGLIQENKEPDHFTEEMVEVVKADTLEVANAHEIPESAPQKVPSEASGNNATSLLEASSVPNETVQPTATQVEENKNNVRHDPNSFLNEKHPATIAPTEDIEMKENSENRPQMPITSPTGSSRDIKSTVQVLIVSPRQSSMSAGEGAKRVMPSPPPEPPAKRKRGRPRKHPIQSKPEPESEAEAQPEPELEFKAGIEPVATEAIQITEPERTNTGSPISENGKPLTPTEITNDITPESSKDAKGPVDSTNTKKEADQSDLPSSPLSEPPEELSSSLSEPEPRSNSRTKPPLQSIPYGPNEVIITGIKTPANLVNKLLQIDGRPKEGARTANAWKEIRCYRKNQDMGSLFEVRQTWYYKQKRSEKEE